MQSAVVNRISFAFVYMSFLIYFHICLESTHTPFSLKIVMLASIILVPFVVGRWLCTRNAASFPGCHQGISRRRKRQDWRTPCRALICAAELLFRIGVFSQLLFYLSCDAGIQGLSKADNLSNITWCNTCFFSLQTVLNFFCVATKKRVGFII